MTRGVDMWWRRGSKQLIVTSEMDGTVIANVITQDLALVYGWPSYLKEKNGITGQRAWRGLLFEGPSTEW